MIDAEGGISEVIEADVTNEQSCQQAIKRTVQLFGTVHILVNVGTHGSNRSFYGFYLTGSQSVLVALWEMQPKSIWKPGIVT